MPDVRGRVLVRRPAAHAVLRVRRVLEGRPRAGRIVDAEHHGTRTVTRELADLRVVPVQGKSCLRRQRLHGRPPPRRDVLQLAVAIELVAEEIAETDGARTQALR